MDIIKWYHTFIGSQYMYHLIINLFSPWLVHHFRCWPIKWSFPAMWPPSDVCWFVTPMNTIVISTINHSYWFINHSKQRYIFTINHSEIGVICTNWTLSWPGAPRLVPLRRLLASIFQRPDEPTLVPAVPSWDTPSDSWIAHWIAGFRWFLVENPQKTMEW